LQKLNQQHHQKATKMSIPPSVRPTLVQLVEEHITSLIRDAVTIQRHCKRARLNHVPTDSTNTSLHNTNAGNSNTANNYFKTRLHAADINLALQLQGGEKLYGNVNPMNTPDSQQQPHTKVMLSDLLKEEVPPPPEEVSMEQHWLVVDGIPTDTVGATQNPDVTTIGPADHTTTTGPGHVVGALDPTYESSEVILRVHQLQSGLLSEELKLYFLRVVTTIERGSVTQFDRDQQDMVLHQLEYDDGLQELVPFLVRYAQHAIYEHVATNTDHCVTIMRMIRALLTNPTLHLELHLHELLPALMTCIVAQSLGEGNTGTYALKYYNNHWNLRQEASTTLFMCCALFGNEYATLKSRILRALCQALDAGSLPSRYGGTVAITLFGSRTIDSFLLPLLVDCWDAWEEELGKTNINQQLEVEIVMCQQALLTAICAYLHDTTLDEKAERLLDLDLDEILGGDRMMIFSGDETKYNMCFV
jgi:transcription initiation factor TFIID subunit 6